MLEQEKIIKNTKKYFESAQKYGFMTEDLMTFLGEEFMKAPASTMTDLYNAFEGGLIDYLLTTTKYSIAINTSLPENERVDVGSLVKVCLLHQIGKAKLYKPCESEWHRKNQGKMYDFNEDIVSMRVGERSVFYALSNGVKLNEEEYASIINHDKGDDKMSEFHNTKIGEILKAGSKLAIMSLKTKK
jgi:hypothetical protein